MSTIITARKGGALAPFFSSLGWYNRHSRHQLVYSFMEMQMVRVVNDYGRILIESVNEDGEVVVEVYEEE